MANLEMELKESYPAIIKTQLSFRILAVFELYCWNICSPKITDFESKLSHLKSLKDRFIKDLLNEQSNLEREAKLFQKIENMISNELNCECKSFARPFDNCNTYYKWTATIYSSGLYPNGSKKLEIKFNPPIQIEANSCIEREFGSDRLLHVSITDLTYDQISRWYSKIYFGGQTFIFLGGKPSSTSSSTSTESKNNDSSTSTGKYTLTWIAWYVSLDNESESHLYQKCCYGRRGRNMTGISNISEIRDWCGDFDNQPACKINSRLQLLFSPTYPSKFVLNDSQIIIEDDIMSEPGDMTSFVMTDGCGYISRDLAEQIPRISNGIARHSEHKDHLLPAVIQVRIRSNHGLIKGLFVVRDDIKGIIIVRKSMLKSKPSTCIHNQNLPSYIDIKSTFHSGVQSPSKKQFTLLNRRSILMLVYCRVPLEIFEGMMKEQLDHILKAPTTFSGIKSLIRKHFNRNSNKMMTMTGDNTKDNKIKLTISELVLSEHNNTDNDDDDDDDDGKTDDADDDQLSIPMYTISTTTSDNKTQDGTRANKMDESDVDWHQDYIICYYMPLICKILTSIH